MGKLKKKKIDVEQMEKAVEPQLLLTDKKMDEIEKEAKSAKSNDNFDPKEILEEIDKIKNEEKYWIIKTESMKDFRFDTDLSKDERVKTIINATREACNFIKNKSNIDKIIANTI